MRQEVKEKVNKIENKLNEKLTSKIEKLTLNNIKKGNYSSANSPGHYILNHNNQNDYIKENLISKKKNLKKPENE